MSITGSFGTLSINGEKIADVESMQLESPCDEQEPAYCWGDPRRIPISADIGSFGFRFDPEPCAVIDLRIYIPTRCWRFPTDPFVIYEPSDESWCRCLGIGREVEESREYHVPRATMQMTDAGVKFSAITVSNTEADPCLPKNSAD